MNRNPYEVHVSAPLYADPAFDTVGIGGASYLFEYYLRQKQPALKMLYEAAAHGGHAQWRYACTPLGNREFELQEELVAEMQIADSAAAAFFVIADTLLESLSSALHVLQTGKRRTSRKFEGPFLADVMQAAGNFARHSAEWGAEARDGGALSKRARTSALILGTQLGATEADLVPTLLGTSWRMFALLHSLFGERTNLLQHPTFDLFEATERAIIGAAREMIEKVAAAIPPTNQGPEAI